MTNTIKISEIVGSEFCLTNEEGHSVHKAIFDELSQNNSVILSFEGVNRTTTAFLNVAVGQLYGEFDEKTIREHMAIENAEAKHLQQLKRVVDGAKLFFSDEEKHAELRRSIHED